MNFGLSEEQQMLSDSVDRMMAGHAQAAAADPISHWQDYCDLGLPALSLPEAQGGYGGAEEVMIAFTAYGRYLAEAPLLQTLLAGRVLSEAAGERAHDLLARIISGQDRVALCLWEPNSGWHWDAPQTRADPMAQGWRLSGQKTAVLDADESVWLLCPARMADGIGLFLVPPNSDGAKIKTMRTPDGRRVANFAFDGAYLPADTAIGDPTKNGALLASAIDEGIAAVCAEMVGAMDRLLEITVEYMETRKQFGVSIGSFQALQHRAADMLIEIEQAKSMTFHTVAAQRKDAANRSCNVAAAKALVNRAARFVGQQAIQLHGGMGMTEEYPAGRYFQRLTVLEMMFGDTDHHLSQVEKAGGLTG